MKNKFKKLALAFLAVPLFAASAFAESVRAIYNGYVVTVEITLHDPECGDQGVITYSPISGDIGKVVILK